MGSNQVKEIPTHWVGCTGNEYPIEDYINHGHGGYKHGFKDLPINEYPYSIKYRIERLYYWCDIKMKNK